MCTAAAAPVMKFASAAVSELTTGFDPLEDSCAAVADGLVEQLAEQLGDDQPPDLLIFFNASNPRAPMHGREVAAQLRERCAARWGPAAKPPVVLGASWGCDGPGTGVIGGSTAEGEGDPAGCQEIQQQPALTVLGASLPGVRVMPFHAEPEHDGLPRLVGSGSPSWAELALLPAADTGHVVLLTDPSAFGMGRYSDTILKYFDNALPFATKVGGLVPGGGLIYLHCDASDNGANEASFVGDQGQDEGMSYVIQGVGGVVLQGNIEVDTLVRIDLPDLRTLVNINT